MGGSFEIISESLLDWIYLVVLVQKCIAQKNSNDYLGDVMIPAFFEFSFCGYFFFILFFPCPCLNCHNSRYTTGTWIFLILARFRTRTKYGTPAFFQLGSMYSAITIKSVDYVISSLYQACRNSTASIPGAWNLVVWVCWLEQIFSG